MKIDQQALHKIAHLARLEVKPEEEEKLINSLENVLSWMEHLDEIDTTGVEPLRHISAELNVMREDVVGNHLSREKGLLNAPSKDDTYFRVPKVIE
jgi:aspartyl-tRNA(Asn)/glutamyl-tRNA(Gln) amidotransferase subunit C